MPARKQISLPGWFDPDRHANLLADMVAQHIGGDFEVEWVDPQAGTVMAVQRTTVASVGDRGQVKTLELASNPPPKPADGDRIADRLAEQFPGWHMTRFDPYLCRAEIRQLSDQERRCRGAVAAAVGVKPWDIGVRARHDGGFDLDLHGGYVPSKHYDKLVEVATGVVGKPGWYVTVDPHELTAQIVPADLPTFPATIPLPQPAADDLPAFDLAGRSWAQIPVGWRLPDPGEPDGQTLCADFGTNPAMQISGLMGGGKGVVLTSLLAGMLARGWQVGLVDAVKSGVDYIDFQPYVADHLWGGDSRQALAVLGLAYQEGKRRLKLIQQYRVQRFDQLPPELGIRPLAVLVDEATSLIGNEKIPAGIPKDHPVRDEIAQRNLLGALILNQMAKIPREMRFAGVAIVLATQQASVNEGIPTELRGNLPAKVLMGTKPTESARKLALGDPDAVPGVPDHVAQDTDGAALGAGVYQFAGQKPGVFKSFFTPPDQIAGWLASLGLPTTDRPEPTESQIATFLDQAGADDNTGNDSGNGGAGGERAPSGKPAEQIRAEMGDSWDVDPDTGQRVTGYQKANLARHMSAQTVPDTGGSGDDPPPWD